MKIAGSFGLLEASAAVTPSIFGEAFTCLCRGLSVPRLGTNGREIPWVHGIGVPMTDSHGNDCISSILIGFSIVDHPFWGTPSFGNTHIYLHGGSTKIIKGQGWVWAPNHVYPHGI